MYLKHASEPLFVIDCFQLLSWSRRKVMILAHRFLKKDLCQGVGLIYFVSINCFSHSFNTYWLFAVAMAPFYTLREGHRGGLCDSKGVISTDERSSGGRWWDEDPRKGPDKIPGSYCDVAFEAFHLSLQMNHAYFQNLSFLNIKFREGVGQTLCGHFYVRISIIQWLST